jgi:uncharacterized protein (DUF362 family)
MTTVALTKGDDRFSNVLRALELAGDEVARKIRGNVLVKINTVVGSGSPADTHPEALAAVLEYLARFGPKRMWVGEGSGDPMATFSAGGYLPLAERYPCTFVDFNALGFDELDLCTLDGKPLAARISKAIHEFDCLVSLSVPKAHSDAVVTLSGKNMMGFLETGEMWRIHGIKEFGADDILVAGTRTIHKNLRTLLARVRPDVAVLDGFHSFEGGPVPQCARGRRVEPRLALAGADFVAVDTVAASALGFDPNDVGYLVYAARDGWGTMDLAEIRVVGTPIAEARFPLAPAPRNEVLVRWQEPQRAGSLP